MRETDIQLEGELDILEQIDGDGVGHGTAHCDVNPGGICNESNGLGASVKIPGHGYETWRLQWDKTENDWTKHKITWSMSGKQYHTITGAQIGDQSVWNTLANDPMFFILNVAVGGGWVSLSSLPSNRNTNNELLARIPQR